MDNLKERDQLIRNQLLEVLGQSENPLSSKNIGAKLRSRNIRHADFRIIEHLRALSKDNEVHLEGVKWVKNEVAPILSQKRPGQLANLRFPHVSEQTLSLLTGMSGPESTATLSPGQEGHVSPDTTSQEAQNFGRWGFFRRLLSYYRQCIRNEEGAEAFAFQNQLGERFVYLRKIGAWYPKPSLLWQAAIPISQHLSGLMNHLPGPSDEDTLLIGYPVHAHYKEEEGAPPTATIRPIFYFPVEYSIGPDRLIVKNDSPKIEINLNWLEFAFKSNANKQKSFLSVCGFINRGQNNDEGIGMERGEEAPNLGSLAAAIKVFLPEKIAESLQIDSIPDHLLEVPFKSGIYNRAVLMLAKKTRYSVTLLKELSAIEKASDEVLDQTALRRIFAKGNYPAQEISDLIHEEKVIDTTPLNAEQRWAVACLLDRPLTVITGPPGTGKSQVVSAAVLNARLQNQTVLFASRNHKAIDAVYNRLVGPNQKPLMVRTNSKDDPTLNYTFSHAIKEMLLEQSNTEATQRLSFAKDEISGLLKKRGELGRIVRQCAKAGTQLGDLEERMGYLGREIPSAMKSYIDEMPTSIPGQSLTRVCSGMRKILNNQKREHIQRFWRCLILFPWYWKLRGSLRAVPESPVLPPWPAQLNPQTFFECQPILEKAAEYCQLRLKSKIFEDELKTYPPLEELTGAIAEITHRLEEISQTAILLDSERRRGVPQAVERDEFAGLAPAIRAMRTGLDEGHLRAEVVQQIKKHAPHVLTNFPCWAVTNLSVGSRLPMISGLFDIAIVDEASQSDIPSAIPLLFRAKRAGVVGDPFQLTHCSKLSIQKDTLLRRSVGIKKISDIRYAYSEHSLYDLLASTSGVETVFLSETYRSASGIAQYSNTTFYEGKLRVATDEACLKIPIGKKPGIHWTTIAGEIQSGGGSGCFCTLEVETIAQLVRDLLMEKNYSGTIGIVTPFRQQANRIHDALFGSDMEFYRRLLASKTHIDTAHGFQGDERDVIIFSLCAGPSMPIGSKGFIKENPNLFNVAVSRARAVLHIVGNLAWARQSNIRHIERLATANDKPPSPPHGPWHPHESPYEKILYEALVREGLEPRPQFPVLSRRLDMALIGDGSPPIRLDIEVDGDCHRNSDGTRKMDDVWRDIQLQSIGWKVLRFWTYKLREDLKGCVNTVVKAWREND